jgi:hypothetical protein
MWVYKYEDEHSDFRQGLAFCGVVTRMRVCLPLMLSGQPVKQHEALIEALMRLIENAPEFATTRPDEKHTAMHLLRRWLYQASKLVSKNQGSGSVAHDTYKQKE